jgi:hypothetical protein
MWYKESPNEAANAEFLIADINSEDFEEDDEIYDYIHGRGLHGCIKDLPELIGKCYKLAPLANCIMFTNVSIGHLNQMVWSSSPDLIFVFPRIAFRTNYCMNGKTS